MFPFKVIIKDQTKSGLVQIRNPVVKIKDIPRNVAVRMPVVVQVIVKTVTSEIII